jgi:hypothetical protein
MLRRRGHEPVRIEGKRFAFLPEAFTWHGCHYMVRAVERCWTQARGSGKRRIERRYFRVQCDGGRFELCHDVVANTWCVRAG